MNNKNLFTLRSQYHCCWWPVASFTKEVNPRLAKCPLVFNGRLVNCGLTSLVKKNNGDTKSQDISTMKLTQLFHSILVLGPGGWINIKMSSYQYRKSHCRDKTILRPSYLHNGISYTGKMTSLYWIRALKTYLIIDVHWQINLECKHLILNDLIWINCLEHLNVMKSK